MRQKSLNLQKMSHSISQNLIDMKYRTGGSGSSGIGTGTGSSTSMNSSGYMSGSSMSNAGYGGGAGTAQAQTHGHVQSQGKQNGYYHHREDQFQRQRQHERQHQRQLPTLPPEQTSTLLQNLNTFLTHHLSFHRPIALVTSGGTITTLEQNTIRYLDNFSTGQRGAISVEEFCKRGYAVVHLWREGSTAPYSRVLSKLLGCKKGNYGLGPNALGLLFEGQQGQGQGHGQQQQQDNGSGSTSREEDVKQQQQQQQYHDPWLTRTHRSQSNRSVNSDSNRSNNNYINNINYTNDQKYSSQNRMNLTTHILHNNLLQRKLRERSDVIANNLLYTVPFTSVEEYIALLKIITEAMDQCQSLGLIYLAAAVSDFYIPEEEKCVHKIQSRDYGIGSIAKDKDKHKHDGVGVGVDIGDKIHHDNSRTSTSSTSPTAIVMNQVDNTLSLTLQPVPKVIQHITQKWSPHAFCVSFKLETDETILRKKVHQAMNKYNVQLIVGNVLDTRHEKVSLFEQKRSDDFDDDDNGGGGGGVNNDDGISVYDGMKVTHVTKSNGCGNIDNGDDDDELEDNIITHVVEKHFEYIANHYLIEDKDNYDDDDELESIDGGDGTNVLPRTALMTGAEAAARHNAYMRKKKEALKREMHWKRLRDVSLNIAGHAVGCFLTYTLSSAVQTYLH